MEEVTGKRIVSGAWRGIAAPAGLPEDIKAKYVKALRNIWESEDFKKGMEKFGYGLAWMEGEEFDKFLVENDVNAGIILEATKGEAKK